MKACSDHVTRADPGGQRAASKNAKVRCFFLLFSVVLTDETQLAPLKFWLDTPLRKLCFCALRDTLFLESFEQ
jgi:hypothetical protein